MSNKAQAVPKGPHVGGTFSEIPGANEGKTGSSQPLVSQVTTGNAIKIIPAQGPEAHPLQEHRNG